MDNDFEQARTRLAAKVARWTLGGERFVAPIDGLSLYRHAEAGAPASCMLAPAIAIPVQGAKQALIGTDSYVYGDGRFLITSVDLPAVLQVASASPERPYLSVVLTLDLELLAQLALDARPQLPQVPEPSRPGVALGHTTAALLEAFDRLVGLLDEPDSIAVMAPLIRREIFFRVLRGGGGAHLLQLAVAGSRRQRIGQAIDWLKANFREPLRVEGLAALADMSPSRFHHHFRQFTAMSPLQFQKWLRLMEARRLMVTQGVGASNAAFDVGYGSVSQFSREYARQFGSPPRRDVEGLLRSAVR